MNTKENYKISKKDLRSYLKLHRERMNLGICESCYKKTIELILERQDSKKEQKHEN